MSLLKLILLCSLISLGSAWTQSREVNTCYTSQACSINKLQETLKETLQNGFQSISSIATTLETTSRTLESTTTLLQQLFAEYQRCNSGLETTLESPTTDNPTEPYSTTESTTYQPPTQPATTPTEHITTQPPVQPTTDTTDSTPQCNTESGNGTFLNPGYSCDSLLETNPPGEYWVRSNDGLSGALVNCTTAPNASSDQTGGWMRIINLDANETRQCPLGLQTSSIRVDGFTTYVCYGYFYSPDCVSIKLSTHGIEYSQVCGRLQAYCTHHSAFESYASNHSITLEDNYVSGASLTYGSPRQHIWTFAVASPNNQSEGTNCPCTQPNGNFTGVVPPFIGQDYFCDRGEYYSWTPIWDGVGCGGASTCCEFNNPPWFCKQLPQPTTDDLELRLCTGISNYTPFVHEIEIYVK